MYCFRKVLLPTPPKMSKEERRQIFEAQVKAQEEMAEIERQQRQAYLQQFYSDPNNYMYYGQDPNCPVPPGFQPPLGKSLLFYTNNCIFCEKCVKISKPFYLYLHGDWMNHK